MAIRAWKSTGSTDLNNAANYTGSGALLTTDSLYFNNPGTAPAVQTATLSVAHIYVINGNSTRSVTLNADTTISTLLQVGAGSKLILSGSPTIDMVDGSVLFDAAAILEASATSIIKTPNITTGGLTLPILQFHNESVGNNSVINDGCTIGRVQCINTDGGQQVTWEAGETFTILAMASSDVSGGTGGNNIHRSSVAGTAFTWAIPNAVNVTRFCAADCAVTGYEITATDYFSIDGGGNTGINFPAQPTYHDRFYFDVSDGVAEGDGSEASPYNIDQFDDYISTGTGGNVPGNLECLRIKGIRGDTAITFGAICNGLVLKLAPWGNNIWGAEQPVGGGGDSFGFVFAAESVNAVITLYEYFYFDLTANNYNQSTFFSGNVAASSVINFVTPIAILNRQTFVLYGSGSPQRGTINVYGGTIKARENTDNTLTLYDGSGRSPINLFDCVFDCLTTKINIGYSTSNPNNIYRNCIFYFDGDDLAVGSDPITDLYAAGCAFGVPLGVPGGDVDNPYGSDDYSVNDFYSNLYSLGSVAVSDTAFLTQTGSQYGLSSTPRTGPGAFYFVGPPTAAFSISANPAKVNTSVCFTDLSTGEPTSWIWDFGDGSLSYEQNPCHVYTSTHWCNKAKGSYVVTLTAINDYGRSSTSQTLVIIVNDSIEDLSGAGTTEVLWKKPNRQFHPQRNWEHNIEIYQHGEGITRIHDVSAHTAHIYKALWTQMSKADESELLAFFVGRQGRYRNFWLPHWQNTFRLYASIAQWDATIRVHHGYFADTFNGYERFFIELVDRSIITRHIISVTDNGDDTETLHIETPMDRTITQDDIVFFGRLVLTRFDQDEIEFEHHTSDNSDCNLMASFLELTEEYTKGGGAS